MLTIQRTYTQIHRPPLVLFFCPSDFSNRSPRLNHLGSMPRRAVHITTRLRWFSRVPAAVSVTAAVQLSKPKIRASTLTAVHRSSYQTLHSTLPLDLPFCCVSVQQCALTTAHSDVRIPICANVRISGRKFIRTTIEQSRVSDTS